MAGRANGRHARRLLTPPASRRVTPVRWRFACASGPTVRRRPPAGYVGKGASFSTVSERMLGEGKAGAGRVGTSHQLRMAGSSGWLADSSGCAQLGKACQPRAQLFAGSTAQHVCTTAGATHPVPAAGTEHEGALVWHVVVSQPTVARQVPFARRRMRGQQSQRANTRDSTSRDRNTA